jgi:hypothetical protein
MSRRGSLAAAATTKFVEEARADGETTAADPFTHLEL